jgi:adenosylhomocysteine nucleosidase
MRILVTFAVDAEFAPWRRRRSFTKHTIGDARIPVYRTSFGNNAVEVLLTGIGIPSCADSLTAYEAAKADKPDCVISAGLAGALKESMKPGDLFTPERVRRLKDEESAVADPFLREGAVQQGALPTKTLITMTRLVSTREEKSRLAFFGEAIDMESAAVMAHFNKRAVPSVTVRAISDAADEDLPVDFDRCLTPQGAIKPLSLVNEIVRRPGNLSNLVRFGRQSNQAAQKLIAFLDQFVVSLPAIREKAVMA